MLFAVGKMVSKLPPVNNLSGAYGNVMNNYKCDKYCNRKTADFITVIITASC